MAMTVNVRAAPAYVARGEAPLGIVYATDAKVEPGVKVARSDHLSDGGDCERQAGDDAISGVPAVCSGQIDIRGLRLLGAGKAHILNQQVNKDFAH
jgi:hypothetical protein